VADIYDALRQRRVYKPSMPIKQALGILRSDTERGDLDPKAVALLESCLDEIEKVCGPLRPGWDEEQAAAAAAAAAEAAAAAGSAAPVLAS
jgi:HD-GYP domain-containing protein (c-di-GMP phosphodiesterase class II)